MPLKIQSSPKCKARKEFRSAAYVLYVSKKFFPQRSSWDEMWIFRGAHLKMRHSLANTVTPREVWSWAMYDFANSGYTTVVITAIFNAYFV